jgi:hypothetical protein
LHIQPLDGLYTQGAVPLTYKAFYYGMTKAPESLPPIT